MWDFLDFVLRVVMLSSVLILGRIIWVDAQRELDQKHGGK
jgi:hypothetical protein